MWKRLRVWASWLARLLPARPSLRPLHNNGGDLPHSALVTQSIREIAVSVNFLDDAIRIDNMYPTRPEAEELYKLCGRLFYVCQRCRDRFLIDDTLPGPGADH